MDTQSVFTDTNFNYGLFKEYSATQSIDIQTNNSTPKKNILESKFRSDDNILELIKLINQKSTNKVDQRYLYIQILKYIDSWIELGIFSDIPNSINITTLIDYYNTRFVNSFSKDILKITELPNENKELYKLTPDKLNGMYVQQDRNIDQSQFIKKTPFYEKALYVRRYDKGEDDIVNDIEVKFKTLESRYVKNRKKQINDYSYRNTHRNNIEREVPQWSLK